MNHQLKTIDIYNQHVSEYVEKFMNFDLYDDTFDEFLNYLPKGSNVLELGCGPGNVIKYFLDKRPDLNITGIDLAPKMVSAARLINPTANFEVMDIRNVSRIGRKFSAVVAAFCLPYLSNENLSELFEDISKIILPNAYIYLSCMEGEKEKSGLEKTSFTGDNEIFIYYQQRENIEVLLRNNGFAIEKFYTKKYPESDGTFTIDLIYIARKIS